MRPGDTSDMDPLYIIVFIVNVPSNHLYNVARQSSPVMSRALYKYQASLPY